MNILHDISTTLFSLAQTCLYPGPPNVGHSTFYTSDLNHPDLHLLNNRHPVLYLGDTFRLRLTGVSLRSCSLYNNHYVYDNHYTLMTRIDGSLIAAFPVGTRGQLLIPLGNNLVTLYLNAVFDEDFELSDDSDDSDDSYYLEDFLL